MPEEELKILAQIYEKRGLKKETAMQVAIELTEKDALAAHIRDELGLNEISQARPIQAAFASGAAFTVGGILPLLVALFLPLKSMEYTLYGFALFFLFKATWRSNISTTTFSFEGAFFGAGACQLFCRSKCLCLFTTRASVFRSCSWFPGLP